MQKLSEHRQLRSVWKRAAHRFKEAHAIVVIGYSWPNGDQFFHHLFALGSIGDTFLRTFIVADLSEIVPNRFRVDLLGTQQGARFAALAGEPFSEKVVEKIGRELGVESESSPSLFVA
jgi:hypothetical protein